VTEPTHWSKRHDLPSPDVHSFGNELQQTDDVRARGEFTALGVVAVWRRVTFLSCAQIRPSATARMPDRKPGSAMD
jgi:hypothetical protein